MRELIRAILSKSTSYIARTPLKHNHYLRKVRNILYNQITPKTITWIDYRGYDLLIDPSDHLGRQLFRRGEYEPNVEKIISQHVQKGDIAFDIGANVGQFTLCMRDCIGDTGNVYAFEPLPENVELLNKTVNKNGLSNVNIVNKAVGEKSDSLELYVEESNRGNSTLYPNQNYDKTVEIDVVPLTKYTDNVDNVDFMKIDVEGAELDVIRGLGKNIKKFNYILLEIHYHNDHHMDYDINELFETLSSYGSIFGISTALDCGLTKQCEVIQTADELSKYERVIWTRDGFSPKHGIL